MNGDMGKEIQEMTARVLTAALVACLFLVSTTASASAAAPALKLTATSQPTNFVAGSDAGESVFNGINARAKPQYSIVATNIGSAATSGSITFTDVLPTGITPTTPVARDFNNRNFSPEISCSVSGQEVTCVDPVPIQPGEWAQVFIPVKVALNAPSSAASQVKVVGGGAAEATTTTTTTVSSSTPSFGFLTGPAGFSATITDSDGQPATQAGSHPYGVTLDLGFPSAEVELHGLPAGQAPLYNVGHPRDLRAVLPRGMVVNPTATPVRCTEDELEAKESCPDASQVGTVTVLTELLNAFPNVGALYNMVPPPGAAAELGFDATGTGVFAHLLGGVNTAGEYELASDTEGILARELNPILTVQAQLWGNPSDSSHDFVRGACAVSGGGSCPLVDRPNIPFLTMPSSCRTSLKVTASATSWEDVSNAIQSTTEVSNATNGIPTGTDGCNQLSFDPTIEAKPTTNRSDSPSGFDFKLHIPQNESIGSLAESNLRDTRVVLPAGLSVNPSSANGLDACTAGQFGLQSEVGRLPIRTNNAPATCPNAAKIGALEVSTQLLDHPVSGSIYVAKPYENPFGSLLAIYLTIYDEQTGVVIKLAGKVDADPTTGRLTASFVENPELPFEDFKLNFFGGPRASLKTPLPCATYKIASDLTPWSSPEGVSALSSDSFEISSAARAGTCPPSEAAAPHQPAFTAGTISPLAGAYSPLVLKLSREDGSQRLTGIETTLPRGLAAKFAGVPYCSEPQISAARSREAPNRGILEQQSPSCPQSTEVGTVSVGAGAGITPYYAQGHAYLAGPYKGAPLSLVVIAPAVAGPFDLGAVVNRTALYVNSETAQGHAVSDPLPTILQGIPLDVRSIALKLDRPHFTLNPTSCNPMSVVGAAVAATGQTAALSSPFQVGSCSALKFAPKLSIGLKGGTRRTKHPALRAVLTYPKGNYANIARAQVTLPHAEFLDNSHFGTICTRVQFAADSCPKESIYGFARAFTPLLDKPVEGPVYLRSSNHKLPDLVAALDGQIDVDVVGRVDTGKGGGIRNTFEAVPDAPVSKFVLELKSGKKGLLINSENICSKPQRAIADFTAQNGKVLNTTPLIANSCKGKKAKKPKTRP